MMECKAALTEANGDFDEANTILRTRGLATAAKKAGRVAKEGLIGHRIAGDHSSGILVEVNCESDFVARTDDFQQLIADVIVAIEARGESADAAWLEAPDGPVKKRVAATIAKLGENIAVSRFVRYAGGYVGQYIHMGGKTGSRPGSAAGTSSRRWSRSSPCRSRPPALATCRARRFPAT
jgi:elongation factor Ts